MAGLLAARMTMGHYILLLRGEHIRTVNWGGKPEKTIEEDDEGLKYYGPRRSFALYSLTVRRVTCCPSHHTVSSFLLRVEGEGTQYASNCS